MASIHISFCFRAGTLVRTQSLELESIPILVVYIYLCHLKVASIL